MLFLSVRELFLSVRELFLGVRDLLLGVRDLLLGVRDLLLGIRGLLLGVRGRWPALWAAKTGLPQCRQILAYIRIYNSLLILLGALVFRA